MAVIDTFIPEIWNARLLHNLDNAHVATSFVNRNYEGEIKNAGDTVHINSIGPITVKDYAKNTNIDAAEDLTTEDQTLVIDQCKYFHFQVDDIDKVQASGELIDVAMKRAAYGLADTADKFIFATMAAGAAAGNVITETAPLSKDTVYSKLVALRTKLDKANAPTTGRKLAIPPEVYGMLLENNVVFGTSSAKTADEVILNGYIGDLLGFSVFVSNNLPVAAKAYSMIASVDSAATFAEQIVKTEAYRAELRFNDAVKGLHVYGAKVIDGNGIAVLKAKVAPDA